MNILEKIKNYKVKAKKLYTVIALTIIEMIGIVWLSNWVITPAILIPLVQFVAIFEHRDVWKKLNKKEKEEITLTEKELDNFVKVIVEKLEYMSVDEILFEIKK